MMRSIAIFSFFALATVLVIILQPGPRPDYTYQPNGDALHEASRNDMRAQQEPRQVPALQAPDEIIAKLKAAAQPERARASDEPPQGGTSGSLQRLQAVLNASLGTADAPTQGSELQRQADPVDVVPAYRVAPELRDMSWQTLNALNGLGRAAKAPGQEGSLLNSIVRRSMVKVGNEMPVQQQSAALTSRVVPKLRDAAVRTAAVQSYIVAPGDTLALIAIKLYGSALATDRLLSDNPVLRENPNALRIGQVLQYGLR